MLLVELLHCSIKFLPSGLPTRKVGSCVFCAPSTDVSADILTDTSVECRSTYRPILGQCIGRYICRHSTDISTEICQSIGRSRYRSISRLTYRPRLFVRLSGDMSIDRLSTLCRYFTHTCVRLIVACVADII